MEHEDRHVALPKLYGAPAYARPPRPVEVEDRPADPDDLPLEAYRADDDEEDPEGLTQIEVVGAELGASPSEPIPPRAPGRSAFVGDVDERRHLDARPFSVRRLRRFLERR